MGRVYVVEKRTGKTIEIHYKVHSIECKKCKLINKQFNKKNCKLSRNND
jgi:hypothetical protein